MALPSGLYFRDGLRSKPEAPEGQESRACETSPKGNNWTEGKNNY